MRQKLMKSMNREEIKNLEAKLNEVEGRSDKFEKLIVKKLDEMAQFQKLNQPQTQECAFSSQLIIGQKYSFKNI